MSIFPDTANGGIVVRTVAGVCVAQSEAPNAYCPPPGFVMNCNVTALAEDCTARVMPSQINAIVSELLCLGVALDPNGPWDCNSNCNLSTMFQTFITNFRPTVQVITDGTTIEGDGTAANPISLIPGGAVEAICGDDDAADALAECLISSSPGNKLTTGLDGRLFISTVISTESPITGDGSEENPLGVDIPALISADGTNLLGLGTDQKLFVTVAVAGSLSGTGSPSDPIRVDIDAAYLVSAVCTDAEARTDLAACLVSEDAGNSIGWGSDGGLFFNATVPATQPDGITIVFNGNNELTIVPENVVFSICSTEEAREALASCMISSDSNNGISLGTDGRLYGAKSDGIADGSEILFEIAFARAVEYADTDILSAYVTTLGFTLPEDLLNSKVYTRNLSADVNILLYKNNVGIAQFTHTVGGVTTWIMIADISFAVGDVLEFRANGAATFDVLAVTLQARRAITLA